MLYYLFSYLYQHYYVERGIEFFSPFRVFRYISFRAGLASMTALVLSIIIGPWFIRKLYQLKIGQQIRTEECPPLATMHRDKKGTPTMGGILILVAILVPTLIWIDLHNVFSVILILSAFCLGILGGRDDYLKIKRRQSKGLTIRSKLIWQILLGLLIGSVLYFIPKEIYPKTIFVPFYKHPLIDMSGIGIIFIVFAAFVIVASSNAVNLTDGLDGLAIGCTIVASAVYIIISYITGNIIVSDYLNIQYVRGSGEAVIFLSSMIGAGLGFLWFNAYPAQVFMGDTGSLALGGAIGTVALVVKKEILLILVGGVFVIEALSVLTQIYVFRTRHRRFFLIAPIHHHFEMKGYHEVKVTVRFWIVAVIFALISLASIKLQ
jgi:phospho-N-acetylmuramoyl-pentapeptide-transferase